MCNYTLKFENHYNALLAALSKFRETKKLHDVCFLAGSEKVYVNRTVLAAFSPHMEQVLSEVSNDNTVVFVAHGISANTMHQLIDFMYQGVICVSQEDVMPLLKAAKIYQIVGLKDYAFTHSEVTHHNGQQNCMSLLRAPQTQMDPALLNIPPSVTVSQMFSRCSSQTFEQTSATCICTSRGCCPHIAATTHVSITSTPTAPSTPSTASLTCNTGLTISPSPVTPASKPCASIECSTRSSFNRQVTTAVKSPPASPESNSDVEILTVPDPEPILIDNLSPAENSASQSSSAAERYPPTATTTGNSALVATTESASSCSSTPQPSSSSGHLNEASASVSKNSEHTGSPEEEHATSTSLAEKRANSPAKKRARISAPALALDHNKDQGNASHMDLPDSELEKLVADLREIGSSASEDDDAIIQEVLGYSESTFARHPSPHSTEGGCAKRGVTRGPVARRGHSFCCSGAQRDSLPREEGSSPPDEASSLPDEGLLAEESRTVSACLWSKFESACVSSTKSVSTTRAGAILRGRPRGRRGRRPVVPSQSSKPERRKSHRPCTLWCRW